MVQQGVRRTRPIRFATAERFERPREVGEGESRPASGEICPQLPSRLEAVMGPPPDSHPQGEDCLNLVVTTPGCDGAARPVLVWFHGGGFNSGSGLQDWYDGSWLAAQGDLVVVSVNYRLGALGYLLLDGVSEGNLGLYDQLAALRWVRRNIAGYGGDPAAVTVCGQSAGGLSIARLAQLPQARGLFRRAILQSAPLPYAAKTPGDAAGIGEVFAERLGADPCTAPVPELLRAQRETAVAHRELAGSVLSPPFTPVAPDGEAVNPESWPGVDVLCGWNVDEMSAFAGEPGGSTAELTEQVFARPTDGLAAQVGAAGGRCFRYRLDWRPAGSPFGATHCLELPLLLGCRAAWEGSPMLGSTGWDEVAEFGAALCAAWIGFVRAGEPDRAATGGWPVTWEPSVT